MFPVVGYRFYFGELRTIGIANPKVGEV